MNPARRAVPKYYRIMQGLADRIRRGDLLPGARVASENDLIKRHRISNTTARKVLHELERAGWVTRIKGRGTFVNDNRVDRSATRILGFTKNMIEAGRVPSTRVLSVRLRRRGRAMQIHRRRYLLAGPVYEVKRLRLADGVAVMRETRYVSQPLCPSLDRQRLDRSLYGIYERHYGLQLSRVDQRLSAIVADGRELGFPGVAGKIPAFYVEGVTFCGKELILEMEESVYRGDTYRFLVRATG